MREIFYPFCWEKTELLYNLFRLYLHLQMDFSLNPTNGFKKTKGKDQI